MTAAGTIGTNQHKGGVLRYLAAWSCVGCGALYLSGCSDQVGDGSAATEVKVHGGPKAAPAKVASEASVLATSTGSGAVAVALTEKNVDTLTYAELLESVRAAEDLPPQDQPAQLPWAKLRLALSFGVAAQTGKKLRAEVQPGLVVGRMLVAGSAREALRLGKRLQKNNSNDTARLAYVLALAQVKLGKAHKALPQLERALRLAPSMFDALQLRAELKARIKGNKKTFRRLIATSRRSADVDMAARTALFLVDEGQYGLVNEALTVFTEAAAFPRVSLMRRGTVLSLLVRQRIRNGDLNGAMKMAERAETLLPSDGVTASELENLRGVREDLHRVLDPTAELHNRLDAADAELAARLGGKQKKKKRRGNKPSKKQLLALARDQRHAYAAQVAARELMAQGELARAEELFELALWEDPTCCDVVGLVVDWARILMDDNRVGKAEAVLLNLAEQVPGDARVFRGLCHLLARSPPTPAADKRYRVLLAKRPDDIPLVVAYARALIDDGDLSEARKLLEPLAVGAGRNSPEIFVQLARLHRGRDIPRSLELLHKSIELRPTAAAFAAKGDIHAQRYEYREAETAYLRALTLQPKDFRACLGLAKLKLHSGDLVAAKRTLAPIARRGRMRAEVLEMQGDIVNAAGKTAAAVKMYARAIAQSAQPQSIWVKTALLQWQRLRQPDAAAASLRESISVDPDFAEPHYYLGLILREANQLEDARLAFERYVRLDPGGSFATAARRAVDQILSMRPRAEP